MAAFGFDPEKVAAMRLKARLAEEDAGFPVAPENATAVKLLIAMHTQWRFTSVSTMAGATVIRTGLDYGVLKDVADLSGLTLDEGDFARLRFAENEAMNAWSEERSR